MVSCQLYHQILHRVCSAFPLFYPDLFPPLSSCSPPSGGPISSSPNTLDTGHPGKGLQLLYWTTLHYRLTSQEGIVMNSTALQMPFTSLHCNALHCTCTGLTCTVLNCILLHYPANVLKITTLQIYWNILHCTALQCPSLYCSVMHCPCTVVSCTALHCSCCCTHVL